MKDLHLQHIDFDYSLSETYELSILFRQNGISFIITKHNHEQLLTVHHELFDKNKNTSYNDYCKTVFQHKAFSYTYKKVSCLFSTERCTIVPISLYVQNDLETIFTVNHPLHDKEILESYKIKNAESFIIYPISQELHALCTQKFGANLHIYPHIAPLFESAMLQSKQSEKTQMYISIQKSFFDMLIVNGSNILFYNTFTFSNINDYIFYVMNVFEQLQLNPMQIPVVLTGRTPASYVDATEMFIKNVETISPLPSHKKMIQQPPFSEISFPYFYSLFCCNICE